MCRCGSSLSKPKIKRAPRANPIAAGKTFTNPSPGLISMDGDNKLQKLAATIIPPVNPSIPSNMPLCIDLNRKTNDAPKAVTNQVNVVANKAAKTGSIFENHVMISCIINSKIVFLMPSVYKRNTILYI